MASPLGRGVSCGCPDDRDLPRAAPLPVGTSLANACLDEFGAQPWLMSADEYLSGYGTHPLRGTPIEASWDPELGAAMRTRGVAVHEEAVLARLLERVTDLAPG